MLREWDGGLHKGGQLQSKGPIEDADKRLWFPARNDFASQAPAYGVAKVTGCEVEDGRRPFLTITQPDADSLTGCVLIRHAAIDPAKFGQVTFEPWWALYSSGTPAYDEEWGSDEDTWDLKTGATGFKILGGAADGRVLVKRTEAAASTVNVVKFSLTEALSTSDATATADLEFVVTGTAPSSFDVTNLETSTPGTYVFSGGSGTVGYAIQRTSNSDWDIIQMACG